MSDRKVNLRIPVVLTKDGAIQTGSFCRHSDGTMRTDHDWCYDSFTEEEYASGTAVVHVNVVVDIDAVFKDQEVIGEVET